MLEQLMVKYVLKELQYECKDFKTIINNLTCVRDGYE